MSSAEQIPVPDRVIRDYCQDAIADVLNGEEPAIKVSWRDLYRVDKEYAQKALVDTDEVLRHLEEAAADDVDADASDPSFDVWLVDLGEEHVFNPGELRSEHGDQYIGIRGDLSRITTPKDTPTEAAFRCIRCETLTRVGVEHRGFNEPHECRSCERKGPFQLDDRATTWTDMCRMRIETPPGKAGKAGGEHIDGYAKGDIVDYGHDIGLYGRAGDRVIAYGRLERRQQSDGGEDGIPTWETVLEVEAIGFADDDQSVDIEAHREEFEELAAREDAPELFAESLAPELYTTEEWDAALRLAVRYLFKAPRIAPGGGPTYRGDVHMLIVSDYGMGKSLFLSSVRDFSPNAIKKSTTALSSNVGLTAAAVKDDFGADQWAIRPGLLVRSSGGHLLLDELDKTDADLTKMNDALEGDQVVDVEKAGKSATYESRTGLLAAANPEDGRFESSMAVAPQIGMKPSLLNRFDGIVTMEDQIDEEKDAKIAERIVRSYAEAAEVEHEGREELDVLDRPIEPEVGRAWIKYAWENVHPTGIEEHIDEIIEWYAENVRRLNAEYVAGEGAGDDMPVPANAREVAAVVRIAMATARIHLRDTVTARDVDRAKDLVETLVAQNWDGTKFSATREQSQAGRVERVKGYIAEHGPVTAEEVADAINAPESKVENDVRKLKQKRELYEPDGEGNGVSLT